MRPEEFLGVQDRLRAAGLQLDGSDRLTRMPRGFEDLRDSPVAGAIRLRSFLVRRDVETGAVGSPALIGTLADLAADALPLLRFGWAAVDEARAG